MVKSRFNVFFDYEMQKIGFNSFSREYIVIDPTLYLMYESSAINNDFQELSEVHPEFYKFLVEKGFLINETVNETDQVKEVVEKIDGDETHFELHINPTMNCNFKCWYCYETHIKDSKMDESTKENVIKFISSILENKKESLKYFHIGWFGGEPLLYYKKTIKPLLIEAKDLCESKGVEFSSSMTTNALLITSEVIADAKAYSLESFQITLDGDRERHDKVRFISEGKGSYDAIIRNIKELIKNGLRVLVRINCSSETLPGLRNIIDDFEDVCENERQILSFDIHKVWQEHNTLNDEILSETRWYFREKGFTVSTATHDTVLSSCYGDHKNHATINYNGEVFKCTARDFTTSNSEGILQNDGKITWNDKYEKRMHSKFKNKPCLECMIMPICNGGCSQQAIEHDGVDYCVYNFDEEKKVKSVKERFLETLMEA